MTDEQTRAAVERIAATIADRLDDHPIIAVFDMDEWARMGAARPLAWWYALCARAGSESIEAEMRHTVLTALLDHLYDFGKRSEQPVLRDPGYAAIVARELSSTIGHPLSLNLIHREIAVLSESPEFAIGVRRARKALGDCPSHADLSPIAPTVRLLGTEHECGQYRVEATAAAGRLAEWACEAAQQASDADERTVRQALYLWLTSVDDDTGSDNTGSSALAATPFRELFHRDREDLIQRNLLQLNCLQCDARFRAPYRLDTQVPRQLRMWLCPECHAVIHDPQPNATDA